MPIIINIYLIVLLTFSTSAFAYIGPGVGTGMIVTIIGIIIAAVGTILLNLPQWMCDAYDWYPNC